VKLLDHTVFTVCKYENDSLSLCLEIVKCVLLFVLNFERVVKCD